MFSIIFKKSFLVAFTWDIILCRKSIYQKTKNKMAKTEETNFKLRYIMMA